MKDLLQMMLDTQKDSQEVRGYDFGMMNTAETVQYIKSHALYMTVELGEFLQELPMFKDWK